jgi:hypothetical protein
MISTTYCRHFWHGGYDKARPRITNLVPLDPDERITSAGICSSSARINAVRPQGLMLVRA